MKDIRRSTSPIAILIQAANWAPRGRRGSTLQGSQGLGMHSMQDSGHGDRHKACFFTAAKASTSSSIPCLREMVGLRWKCAGSFSKWSNVWISVSPHLYFTSHSAPVADGARGEVPQVGRQVRAIVVRSRAARERRER